jgi:hypothetical protein
MHPGEARDVPGRRHLLELWLTQQMINFFVRALVTTISEGVEEPDKLQSFQPLTKPIR